MAMTPNAQLALIEELLKLHEPKIRKAFLESIRDARSAIDLGAVVNALARGDLSGAMQAVEFSKTFYAPLDIAIRTAYYDSGKRFMNELVADGKRAGTQVTVRFDPGNDRAAQWLRDHSAKLVADIAEDQRLATREALATGMAAGRGPKTTALDVVGRMNRVTGRREGGLIGLTHTQSKWVESAREELQSGDPARMKHYMTRKRRDRRYDPIVKSAIREARPVSEKNVVTMTTRYSDRLLAYRGEVIGRNESLTALSYSQDESARQLLEASGLRPDQIIRTWMAKIDKRTRDAHVALHEDKMPLDKPFVSPSTGRRMRFPRDSELGAFGEDVVQCRCASTLKVAWNGL